MNPIPLKEKPILAQRTFLEVDRNKLTVFYLKSIAMEPVQWEIFVVPFYH